MPTIGEVYGPAMTIDDQAEADTCFEGLVQTALANGAGSRELAEALVRSNLGYYAGYYGEATRERVERLFGARHPVFGAKYPTPEEQLLAEFLWTKHRA